MTKVCRNDIYARAERGPEWLNDFLKDALSADVSSIDGIMNAIHNVRARTVENVVKDYREQVGLDIVHSGDDSSSAVKKVSEEWQDKIPGGLADENKPQDFNPGQLEKGTEVEMEHTHDPEKALEIAMDHLTEDEKYYDKLETIEKHESLKLKSTASQRPLSIRHAVAMDKKPDIILVIKNDTKLQRDVDSLCRHSGGTKSTHSILKFLRDHLGSDAVSYTNDELTAYIEECKDRYRKNIQQSDVDIGLVGTDSQDQYDDDIADYAKNTV